MAQAAVIVGQMAAGFDQDVGSCRSMSADQQNCACLQSNRQQFVRQVRRAGVAVTFKTQKGPIFSRLRQAR